MNEGVWGFSLGILFSAFILIVYLLLVPQVMYTEYEDGSIVLCKSGELLTIYDPEDDDWHRPENGILASICGS